MAELEADLCSCAQEFLFVGTSREADAIALEDAETVSYLNEIDLEAMDETATATSTTVRPSVTPWPVQRPTTHRPRR